MHLLAGTDADDRADDVGRRVHVDAEAVAFLVDDVKPVRDRTTVRHVKLSFVRRNPAPGDSRTAGREPPGAETGGSGDLVDEAEPERLLRRQPQLPAGEQLPDLLRPDR